MRPERVNRVRQRGQRQSVRVSISQRRTSGSEGSFFLRLEPQARQEGVGEEA
jgi:hypothetical protein